MKKLITGILLVSGLTLISSCYYDTAELLYPGGADCSGVAPSYATEVAPLIQSRCAMAGCHNTGATNTGGALTNYTEIKSKAAAVKTSILNGSMPQGSTLTASEKKVISCWVDNGGLNN